MKRAAITTLQIVITVCILWIVFRDPAKRAEMAAALRSADPFWLLLGMLSYAGIEVVAAVRWQYLLRVQQIFLTWPRTFALVVIGVFFNFFVPGGTGGDVVKAFYLMKETPGKRSQALLSVLVDRIVGLFSLVLLAGILVTLHWRWLTSDPVTARYVWIAVLILASSIVGIGISFVVSGFGLVHKLPARLPGRDKMAELAAAYALYGRAWGTGLWTLVVSVVAHIGYFATFFCAAKAFAGGTADLPTFGEICTIMPIVNTLLAVPISLGGVGLREGLFEVFLGRLAGVSGAVAVVISSTGYLLTLIVGSLGGLVYIFYRPTEHARLREMTSEVAALEHDLAEGEVALEAAGGRNESDGPAKAPTIQAHESSTHRR